MGQTVFKSLNKKKQAIFFSLLRKVFIVVPLTYLMPYAFTYGNFRRVPCRTGVQCNRWQSVFYYNAVYDFAGTETDGSTCLECLFESP